MPITFQNVTITGGLQLVSEGAAPPSGDPYWANVSLLMNTTSTNNQINNTFLDGSTSNFTITITGTPTQGSFTPYTVAGGSSYSTATNGGSAYFPGSSYLTAPSSTNFAFGTGDFTVEAWVNFSSTAGAITPICQSDAVGSSIGDKWWFGYSAGALYFACHSGGTPFASIPFTPTLNTWYNVAVTRSSGTMRLFINGVSGTVTNGNGGLSGYTLGQNGMSVGAMSSPYYLSGYLSDVRLVKGTALYTATYSVPTTPLTAVSGTSLLLNFTNAGIFDSSTNNDLALLVNAKVSTTQAKFGTTSSSFGGDNSLVKQISKTTINSSEDFTLECWFYQTAKSSSYVPLICDSSAVYFFPLIIDYGNVNGTFAAGAVGLYTTTSGIITTITGGLFSTGTWNHIAVSRSSGTTRLFVNGTVRITTSTALGEFTVDQIGGASINGFTLNGFLDDVRITKGIARYTSDFSVPTAAFPTF
jgi:hypothetical protein